ncbi:SDR family oxidoreductase [Jatrophihabitans sp.]|jgi:NAD(P)-dependent dehydrogenase (short-subunit alcohol dehydrogenase family)|uniref:SDR family oxidoreductase n=1 Tax=Jatrophihabitans sp. TaxID=1932789 RepID=UPI002F1F3F13
MRIADAVIVVTGGGSGIGAGMARRFVADGARAVVLADRDLAAAAAVASELGSHASAAALDVTDETAMTRLVAGVLAEHGRIDLFCSNAGVATGAGLHDEPAVTWQDGWQRAWEVHVMAHVYAARAVLPAMIAAGGGYLLNTASAAGLLSAPGDPAYTASKHAAVGFAEWLAYTYRDRNIRVSVLCPMGVDTPLLMDGLKTGSPAAAAVAASGEVLGVDEVAAAVVEAVTREAFLVLPHTQVGKFWASKAADVEGWLTAMAGLARQTGASGR